MADRLWYNRDYWIMMNIVQHIDAIMNILYMSNSHYNLLTHVSKLTMLDQVEIFSYMFPVYMVITSENKKMIWKVVFKILTYFAKIQALFRHFYGRNADIW